MTSKIARISFLGLTVVLGACSTSAGGTGSTAPSNVALGTLSATILPTATPTVAPTATPKDTAGGIIGGASPTPGPIDPCTLLTVDEASAVMGVKLGAGFMQELNPSRVCTFKSGESEVKLFLAPPAADAKEAQAYWDTARADVPPTIPVTDLTAFDRSAYVNGSSAGIALSALFVIDGKYFFELYCAFPDCAQGPMLGAADHVAGRLP